MKKRNIITDLRAYEELVNKACSKIQHEFISVKSCNDIVDLLNGIMEESQFYCNIFKEEDNKTFEKLGQLLDYYFFSEKLKLKFIKLLEKADESRKKLLSNLNEKNNTFPQLREAEKYLEAFFKVEAFLLDYRKEFEKNKTIYRQMIELTLSIDEDCICEPRVLEVFGVLYELLFDFASKIKTVKDEMMLIYYRRDIILRTKKDLNFSNEFNVLYFLDKILHELQWNEDNTKKQSFHIAILGNVARNHEESFEYFSRFLLKYLLESSGRGNVLSEIIIDFIGDDFYQDIALEEGGKTVKCKFYKDSSISEITTSKFKNNVVAKYETVFILDIDELTFYNPKRDLEERYLYGKANDCATQKEAREYLRKYYSEFTNTEEHKLNMDFFEYICNMYKGNNTDNLANSIYLISSSSCDSLHYSYLSEWYNKDEYYVFRISKEKEESLENEGVSPIIFPIWQLMKSSFLDEIEDIGQYFGFDEETTTIKVLIETKIGVDFSCIKWEGIGIYYYNANLSPKDKEKVSCYIQNFIIPVLNSYYKFGSESKNIINCFIKKSVDISNLIWISVIERDPDCANFKLKGESEKIKEYDTIRNQGVEIAKYYQLIFNYDNSSDNFAGKYSQQRELGEGFCKTAFLKIKKACENAEYTRSYLYNKVKEKY